MARTGLVPLFSSDDPEVAIAVTKACYEGGARVLEFTSRTDFAHEVFARLSKYCNHELPDMILGVGSVTDAASATLFMSLGANFIVTPVLREDIALACNRRKVFWSAGCGSLTEIARAEELGCEVVKLFPGGIYGPRFAKNIRGPQPWTSIMPTGGVSPDPENLNSWFAAGVTCVGMGSQLITKEILRTHDYASLTETCRRTLAHIASLKSNHYQGKKHYTPTH